MSSDQARVPERLPTLQDVARVAGVSRATVSRVINNVRNVDPEIHKVVSEAVAATGYVPNRAARSLVTGRAGSIALVVSEVEGRTSDDPFMSRFLTDPFFGRLVGGLLSVTREMGINLALTLIDSGQDRQQLLSDLRQGRCDGAAVMSLHPYDPLPGLLAESGLPAVLFGRPAQSLSISHVDAANAAGARLAAERLVARGCTRIATISGPLDAPAGSDRLAGFRAGLLAASGPSDPWVVEGDFSESGGERAIEQLLHEYPDVDGVFVASDLMAQGALPVLRDYGRRIPDDVAVIGFDDSSAAVATLPPLTTVRRPVEAMAAEMARLLMGYSDGPVHRATTVVFEPTLVLRESA